MKILHFYIFITVLSFSSSNAQKVYPPEIENAVQVTYKIIDDIELKLWIYSSENIKSDERRPAIVFFFGGGWREGNPIQFAKHCEYLAERGMIAVLADYRVKNRHGVTPQDCVSDAKSAIRWLRENAARYNIDSSKIVASGASAGGHLAASSLMISEFDTESENLNISSKPNALVLFNPVLVVDSVEEFALDTNKKIEKMSKRMGSNPRLLSPYHNITGNLPPTIIFHGENDKIVPIETIKLFTRKMHKHQNVCTLINYEDSGHGFFNYGKRNNSAYADTLIKMDVFLVSLGYIKPLPNFETISNASHF